MDSKFKKFVEKYSVLFHKATFLAGAVGHLVHLTDDDQI